MRQSPLTTNKKQNSRVKSFNSKLHLLTNSRIFICKYELSYLNYDGKFIKFNKLANYQTQ